MKKIKACPYCGCEEFYIKQRFHGTCYFRFTCEDITGEGLNDDMHDNAEYVNTSKYVYCSDCNKKICKIDEFK
jgi:hypothetical protein